MFVECINISKYLQEIFARENPTYVVVKIDVEGSEYAILDEILRDKTVDLINVLLIEFHGKKQAQKEIEYSKRIYGCSKRIKIYKEQTVNGVHNYVYIKRSLRLWGGEPSRCSG